MTEIEDVAGPAARPSQHVIRPRSDQVGRSEQHGGVEIALDAMLVADPIPARVKRHAPVQRNDVWASVRDRLEQVSRIGPEMDAWNPRRRERVEDRSRVTRDARVVIVSGQRPDP